MTFLYALISRYYAVAKSPTWLFTIEALVLLLIFGELAYHVCRHLKVQHRRKILECLFAEGQKIQGDAPAQQGYGGWLYRVDDWRRRTNQQLCRYSKEAASAFLHDPGAMSNPFVADNFAPEAKLRYLQLQHCLNNLRAIMDKPDVYL